MSESLAIRRAKIDDLPAILAMLADDDVTRARGEADAEVNEAHRAAFAAIEADPNQFLALAVEGDGIVGCFQLTFIPGLSRGAVWRGQVESVRVASHARSRGIGAFMMDWAVAECRRRGCAVVQLTTDKRRSDAHRFYARLGFEASHEGMKLKL